MVDEELILRFFALRDSLAAYKPPLKRVLNQYMSEHRDPHLLHSFSPLYPLHVQGCPPTFFPYEFRTNSVRIPYAFRTAHFWETTDQITTASPQRGMGFQTISDV